MVVATVLLTLSPLRLIGGGGGGGKRDHDQEAIIKMYVYYTAYYKPTV